MNKKKTLYFVCQLSDLEEKKSYGWYPDEGSNNPACFLVLNENKIYSYLNHCPHTGVNLDWLPHQFLDSQGELIQCSTHGALFNIQDGECIHGPCLGQRLKPIKNIVEDDKVYLIFQ